MVTLMWVDLDISKLLFILYFISIYFREGRWKVIAKFDGRKENTFSREFEVKKYGKKFMICFFFVRFSYVLSYGWLNFFCSFASIQRHFDSKDVSPQLGWRKAGGRSQCEVCLLLLPTIEMYPMISIKFNGLDLCFSFSFSTAIYLNI